MDVDQEVEMTSDDAEPFEVMVSTAPHFMINSLSEMRKKYLPRILGGFLSVIDSEEVYFVDKKMTKDGLHILHKMTGLEYDGDYHPVILGESEH